MTPEVPKPPEAGEFSGSVRFSTWAVATGAVGVCWEGADVCLQVALWTKEVDIWVLGQGRKERVGPS